MSINRNIKWRTTHHVRIYLTPISRPRRGTVSKGTSQTLIGHLALGRRHPYLFPDAFNHC